jgi:hypothetical protein
VDIGVLDIRFFQRDSAVVVVVVVVSLISSISVATRCCHRVPRKFLSLTQAK